MQSQPPIAAFNVPPTQLYAQAAAAERARIAHDLHDVVAPSLYAANLIAQSLPHLYRDAPENVEARIHELSDLTHQALAEMRAVLADLHRHTLIQTTLGCKLSEMVETVMASSSLDITLTIHSDQQLPAHWQVNLYYIVLEALNNVTKHAQAQRVHIEGDISSGHGTLSICDDGIGFDLEAVSTERMGLVMLGERAAQIGAQAQVTSQPGQGTEILLWW